MVPSAVVVPGTVDVRFFPVRSRVVLNIESDEATLANGAVAPDKLQFWESEHTRPDSGDARAALEQLLDELGSPERRPFERN